MRLSFSYFELNFGFHNAACLLLFYQNDHIHTILVIHLHIPLTTQLPQYINTHINRFNLWLFCAEAFLFLFSFLQLGRYRTKLNFSVGGFSHTEDIFDFISSILLLAFGLILFSKSFGPYEEFGLHSNDFLRLSVSGCLLKHLSLFPVLPLL